MTYWFNSTRLNRTVLKHSIMMCTTKYWNKVIWYFWTAWSFKFDSIKWVAFNVKQIFHTIFCAGVRECELEWTSNCCAIENLSKFEIQVILRKSILKLEQRFSTTSEHFRSRKCATMSDMVKIWQVSHERAFRTNWKPFDGFSMWKLNEFHVCEFYKV